AVARELRRPAARHREQSGLVRRAGRRHAGEDGVAEHDVGWYALGVGEGAAEHAQALEELAIVRRSDVSRGRGLHRLDEVREARAAAEVADRAARRDRLVEVGDEPLLAAARRLGELVHGHALALRLATELEVLDALLQASMAEHVGPGVEEHAVALEAVAAGAA